MKILVFGNPYLEYDSLAVEIADELKDKAEFISCTSPEQIMMQEFDYIMDVVEGIDEIKVFDNLKLLNPHKMFSLHDFDVTFFLGLMERLGRVDKVKIIGIPIGYDKEKAKKEVKQILKGKV
jgi:Ni,Fe-hydrogenase maturation factor